MIMLLQVQQHLQELQGDIGSLTVPYLSGGKINDHETFNLFGSLEEQNIFLVSDIAGLVIWIFIKHFLFNNNFC